MRIERLDLIAYGRFKDRTIDFSAAPHRFHVVYGPNESGKSTSLRAICDWLFGFEGRTTDDYVFPMGQLRVGGRIVGSEGQELEFVRRKGLRDTMLAIDNRTKIESTALDSLLDGVNKSVFLQQFGLSHPQLVEGGQSILRGEGNLGEILFSAGAGIGALKAMRERLEADRKQLFTDHHASASTLAKAIQDYQQLREQIKNASVTPASYERLRAEYLQAEREAAERLQQMQRIEVESAKLEAIRRSFSLFAQRQHLLSQLQPLTGTRLLPDDFAERRQHWLQSRVQHQQQVERLSIKQASLEAELAGCQTDSIWFEHAGAIERLNRAIGQQEATLQSLRELEFQRTEVRQRLTRLSELLAQSSSAANQVDTTLKSETPLLSDAVVAQIREFSTRYQVLCQSLEDAKRRKLVAMNAVQKATQSLKQQSRPSSLTWLDEAIRSVGNPATMTSNLARLNQQVRDLQSTAEGLLARLSGFDGDLQAAVAVRMPTLRSQQAAVNGLNESQRTVERCQSALNAVVEDLERLTRKIEVDEQASAVPDPKTIQDKCDLRDRLLKELIAASAAAVVFPVQQSIELQEVVRELDRMTQLVIQHHDRVLRRDADLRQAAELQQRRTACEADLNHAHARATEALEDWRKLWQSRGIVAGSVEEMQEWLDNHSQLVSVTKTLAEKQEEFDEAKRMHDQVIRQLQVALQAEATAVKTVSTTATSADDGSLPLFADEDEPEPNQQIEASQDLMVVYRQACQRREEWYEQLRSYDSLVQQHQQCEREFAEASVTLAQVTEKLQVWQSDWDELVAPLHSLGRVVPDSIESMLQMVAELSSLNRDQKELDEKLERRQAEAIRFQEQVHEIVRACAPEWNVNEQHECDLAAKLSQTLQIQGRVQTQRTTLQQQLDQTLNLLAETKLDLKQCEEQLHLLCQEAACDQPEELSHCEEKSRLYRDAMRDLEGLESQLRLLANGQSLDQFEAASQGYDAVAIGLQCQKNSQDLERLAAEYRDCQQEIGRLKAELQAINGSASAAELNQQQQDVLARIRRQADQYARVTVAQEVLTRAIEHFRKAAEGPMLHLAGKFFARMTCERYTSLKVEFDAKDRPTLHAVVDDETVPVPANQLSDGAADALYLSLRLAGLQLRLQSHPPIPLVIDDCLIQFDDERAAQVLRVFSELSTVNQVILFTHHTHLLELASQHLKADEYHVHHLA